MEAWLEHERKELIISILQHIRNLEDLGGIAKLMGFTQDGINSIEEVGTQDVWWIFNDRFITCQLPFTAYFGGERILNIIGQHLAMSWQEDRCCF